MLTDAGFERGPLGAATGGRDGARREELRRFGAGGVEVVGDAGAVDAHADGLADLLVVPRRVVDVEAEVQDVQRLALLQLEVRVVLDGVEVVGADVVDAVDATLAARLQVLEA